MFTALGLDVHCSGVGVFTALELGCSLCSLL